ncbi:nucleotidyltransferase substrate binding protein [Spirosoma pollinicola]|uniref:Nucleotidyltransferase n=1 Tax=Spirosoma pollinicola TaxID=2057025 RepID=A0A2K8Z943_9BACT|nr:nucleotidyltransferase substrate binding protein [Spirosoma pollinicola]AUD06391.1 nucleotidyltransferase [Spirosoma pollinicola]
MESKDVRWVQRFSNYKKALAKLAEVAQNSTIENLSELEREGLIQRFEYTVELSWKTLQDLLINKGYLDVIRPTPVLSQAFKDGYILDAEGWKKMKKARELTSHTYNNETAYEISEAIIATYFGLLDALKQRLDVEQRGTQSTLFD